MPTLDLLKKLISCPSVTPDDAGCQTILAERLAKAGFHIEKMRFENVDNLWARFGTQAPLFVFAGHTDVVPPGPENAWHSPPFVPDERDGLLYGRGAADMKSGLSAMIVAGEHFVHQHPHFSGSIAFLITSDEEGRSNLHGTKRVMEELVKRGEKIDYCVIGEASSEESLGDQIRVGRRGSLNGTLIIHGKQGHIAYPNLAQNPIHLAAPFLHELTSVQWDEGNEFFPPTSFQISNIKSGTGALNVIPGTIEILFNFRFSTAITFEEIEARVTQLLEKHHLNFVLSWELSGNPFLTQHGKLVSATQKVINETVGLDCILSTGGGTSDGRFIAPTGAEVIELGPINASVHQVNEHVRIADLPILEKIYLKILEEILL